MTSGIENTKGPISHWQEWLEHPEKLFIRHIFFQIHLWLGAVATAYILLMSTSGSAIVFRNELAGNPVVEWLVRFHETLLIGTAGRFVNGVGAGSLTLLCLTGAVICGLESDTGVAASQLIGADMSRGLPGMLTAR